jgi:hypothetical protein
MQLKTVSTEFLKLYGAFILLASYFRTPWKALKPKMLVKEQASVKSFQLCSLNFDISVSSFKQNVLKN